jgi:hypothetical protein
MESAESKISNSDKLVDRVLSFGLVTIVISLILAVGAYLWIFNNGISSDSSAWSDFGSFFGGVFSPLISGITLVALIKTLKIQYKALVSQKADAERALEVQHRAFAAQAEQLELARQEVASTKVENYKASVMRVLEQRANYYQQSQADILTRTQMLQNFLQQEGALESLTKLGSLGLAHKVELEKVMKLSLAFSVKEFDSIQAAKEYILSQAVMEPVPPAI